MKKKALMLRKGAQIDWAGIERKLYNQYVVNAVTYNRDGARRTTGTTPLVNEICRLIKKHPKGVTQICQDIEKFLEHPAKIRIRWVTEECAAGMYKIVVPVVQADAIEGFISTCGRPFLNTERIYIQLIHETIEMDEAEISRLLATLDPIGPRTINAIIYDITSYS